MALSKPVANSEDLRAKLNKVDIKNVTTDLNPETIMEVCKIQYQQAISIEIVKFTWRFEYGICTDGA